MFYFFLTLIGISLFPSSSNARPEYAVKYGAISCAACHISPFGGGARNTYGKSYGARNYGVGPASTQDLISGDIRMMAIFPSRAAHNRNGLAFMSSVATANIPIIDNKETGAETNVVAAYSLGVLSAGMREGYVVYRTAPAADQSPVKHIMFGRFNAPFGLLTDEHRTYTRIQTKTSENDFEMGALVSGDPVGPVHYDMALTNGFQSGGAQNTGGDITWAAIGNVRVAPSRLPFFVGASGAYHHSTLIRSPYAASAYGALSFDRMTNNHVRATLLSETVIARGWNDSTLNPGVTSFIPSSEAAFLAAVKNSQSLGWYIQATYDLTDTFTLVYKFDSLTFDRRYPPDSFTRHGVGFRYHFNSNMNLIVRQEFSHAGRASITENSVPTARNAFLVVLHVTI